MMELAGVSSKGSGHRLPPPARSVGMTPAASRAAGARSCVLEGGDRDRGGGGGGGPLLAKRREREVRETAAWLAAPWPRRFPEREKFGRDLSSSSSSLKIIEKSDTNASLIFKISTNKIPR